MKQHQGFTRIGLLVIGAMVLISVFSISYIGIKKYQSYVFEKKEGERQLQEVSQAQQKALNEAQREIEKLKIGGEQTEIQQAAFEKKLSRGESGLTKTTITASELEPYLTGIVRIECGDRWGSGSLWNNKNSLGFSVLTNYHVFQDASECVVVTNEKSGEYAYVATIKSANKKVIDIKKDIALIQLSPMIISNAKVAPFNKFNYLIGNLRECTERMPVGSPVVTIGYPAFATQEVSYKQYATQAYSQIVSNGIVSGYDDSISDKNWGSLPFQNYFVSAKIDSGNSGGVAISKTIEGGLCILGVPTWVSIGNYETQGLIQNIHNVLD